MRQHGKRWFGILLTLALILGLMPGMSLTAYADGTTYIRSCTAVQSRSSSKVMCSRLSFR